MSKHLLDRPVFALKIARSHAEFWTPSNRCLLRRTRVNIPNNILIGSAVFAQLTADSLYTLQRAAPFPPKIAHSHGDLDPHLTHGSLTGPTGVKIPNGITIGSAVYAGITVVTDQQTDRRATLLRICGNRPRLASAGIRLKAIERRLLYSAVIYLQVTGIIRLSGECQSITRICHLVTALHPDNVTLSASQVH